MIRPRSQKNFYAGLMFFAVGAAFAWGATSYKLGDSARMGPGYFPMLVGILLAILGAVGMLKSFVTRTRDGDPIGRWAWRPLAYIIAANFAFGVLLGGLPQIDLPAMGLVAAIYALVLIASRAGGKRPWVETLLLATVLAAGSYATFVMGLELQIQVWPTFITG